MINTIKFPNMFSAAAGRIMTISGADSSKQNLKCSLLTSLGELFGDPDFGSDLKSVIFEDDSPITQVETEEIIRETASKYAPNMDITDIQITRPENTLVNYNIIIYYYLKDLGRYEDVTISL